MHLPCPKGFTLTPKQPPVPVEMDMGKYYLPKHLKYSSMVKDNDIEMIRQRLRKNKVFHLQFDRELDNNEGRMYYTGVYEKNNPAHIKGNPQEIDEPKNYYAYVLSKGLAKEKVRKRGDPVDLIPQLKMEKRSSRRNASMDIRQSRSHQISKFKQFEIHYQRMQDEKLQGPKMAEINSFIDEHDAKRMTKQHASSFRVYRQRLEDMLDAGYYVVDQEKDGHLHKQPNLLSPIEQIVEERQRIKDLEITAENSKENTERVKPMVKIPSQKLSVLIKRKNMKAKNDLKKMQQMQALSARNATNPQMEHCMTPNSNTTSIANPISSINLNQPHFSAQYSQDLIVNETLREKRRREARKLNTIHKPIETKRKVSPKN